MSDIKEFENKMSKTVDALKEDYVTIRAGRANPHILDRLKLIIMAHQHHFSRLPIYQFLRQE